LAPWRILIEPSPRVVERSERRRAVALAGVSLPIVAYGLVSVALDPAARGIHAIVLVLAVAAYAASRTTHLRIAGITGTVACAVTPLVGMSSPAANTSAIEEIVWLVAAVGLPGLCMPLSWAVGLALLTVAGATGAAVVNPEISHGAAVRVGAMTALVTVLSTVYALIRGRNERSLDRAQAFAEQIVESMGDAVFVTGVDGVIRRANGGAAALLSTPADDLLGLRMKELLAMADAERDEACRRIQADGAGGQTLSLAVPGGEPVPVSFRSSPIHDAAGEVLGHVCVARDLRETLRLLTEAAEAEAQRTRADELQAVNEQLVATQEQLVQAAKLATVGELAASVAHELNNPLLAILGYTSLMEQQLEIDRGAEGPLRYVPKMATAARRCQAIVRRWLDFSRRSSSRRARIDLVDVVDTTVGLATPQLQKLGAEIHIELDGELRIRGDANQLGQVVMNLLVNAGQALDERGAIHVEGRRIDGEVRLAVRDDGRGMSPELREQVFQPFFTTKPEGQGTGLGLAVSAGIVADHDGRIEVESSPGEGSTFTMILPVGEG